jgi:hypothetical protein
MNGRVTVGRQARFLGGPRPRFALNGRPTASQGFAAAGVLPKIKERASSGDGQIRE